MGGIAAAVAACRGARAARPGSSSELGGQILWRSLKFDFSVVFVGDVVVEDDVIAQLETDKVQRWGQSGARSGRAGGPGRRACRGSGVQSQGVGLWARVRPHKHGRLAKPSSAAHHVYLSPSRSLMCGNTRLPPARPLSPAQPYCRNCLGPAAHHACTAPTSIQVTMDIKYQQKTPGIVKAVQVGCRVAPPRRRCAPMPACVLPQAGRPWNLSSHTPAPAAAAVLGVHPLFILPLHSLLSPRR